ncbi:hypothetical protein WMR74_004270 [Providencia rettgeri]
MYLSLTMNCKTINKLLLVFGCLIIGATLVSCRAFTLVDKSNLEVMLPLFNSSEKLDFETSSSRLSASNYYSERDFTVLQSDLVKERSYIWESRDKNSVFTIVKLPESSRDWIVFWMSLLAIIISIGVPVWQYLTKKSDDKKDKLIAISEEFWMRDVFVPKLSDLLEEITKKTKDSIYLEQSEFINTFKLDILPSLNELRDSIELLMILSEEGSMDTIVKELESLCDEFDEKLAENQLAAVSVRKRDVLNFYLSFIKTLLKAHKSIINNT